VFIRLIVKTVKTKTLLEKKLISHYTYSSQYN